MGGNYERGMYRQLQELTKDLDNLRSEFRVEREGYEHQIKELREEMASERKRYEQRISELEGELCEVKAENELLKQDNERMKRELNNNSGNSSLPPSSDLPGKAPNTYNARAKSSRAKGGQIGHKGKSLTKADVDRILNRLVSYKRDHLLFLYREDVSFDNNESERNLRKCKNRQKMSGGFREKSGMLMYCTLLSFFETVKKNMGNPYQAALG